MSLLDDPARVESLTVLSRFRTDLYDCLTARADALFELTDALLCADGAVRSLVDLTLTPEHRRGHGAPYDALNCGDVEEDRLRGMLAGLPLPKTVIKLSEKNPRTPLSRMAGTATLARIQDEGESEGRGVVGWVWARWWVGFGLCCLWWFEPWGQVVAGE
ncbi:transposase, partial [Planotetraspora thailandica]